MSFYKGLYKIPNLVDKIQIRQENNNSISGEFAVKNQQLTDKVTHFRFVEIKQGSVQPFSVFHNNLIFIYNYDKKMNKDIEQKIFNFHKNSLSKVVGADVEFQIDKEKKVIAFMIAAFIPYIDDIPNSEKILEPQINIMLAIHSKILLFIMELFQSKNKLA